MTCLRLVNTKAEEGLQTSDVQSLNSEFLIFDFRPNYDMLLFLTQLCFDTF